MDNDAISEAFASITMDDFLRTTSAVRVINFDQQFTAQYTEGVNNWQGWTDTLVNTCVSDLTDDEFKAFAVLHNRQSQRFFAPDDDETAYDFARRLHREALDMEATWFFSAILVPGRTYDEDETPPDIDPEDHDQLLHALDTGLLQMGVCWFSRGLCNPSVEEAGMIKHDEKTDKFEKVVGNIDPEHNPFHEVLH